MIKIFYDTKYWLHKKNLSALSNYKNIEIICDINSLNECDAIFCPDNLYLQKTDKKIIYGPHFSVYPDSRMYKIKSQNHVYILPSQWVKNYWNINGINTKILPFGVDTINFSPVKNINERNNILIYFKKRNPIELKILKIFLAKKNINKYKIFIYGKYNEEEYINYLKDCKYGIWLGCHESQGFALEEALSMNIPLFVWNVKYMSQEYNIGHKKIPCTTIPYWDERCGEYFYSKDELENKFNLFIEKLNTYSPRDYILENLSYEKCENLLIDIIKN